jgi:hypothetical protein
MSILWKALLPVVMVGSAMWWATGGKGKGESSTPKAAPLTFPPAEHRPLAPPSQPYHGLSWQIHHSKDCVAEGRLLLREIADLGADTVLISNPGYQEHAASDSFQIDPAVTPSPEQWKQIFDIAHENGLRVILMPIILLSNPRGTEWRGVISPPNWDDWFEQYRKFLQHFAKIAADGKVEVLMVGSELVSTEKYTDQWRRVIKEARQAFPGKLSYSANWDHYKVVEFWDDLDIVGMTSYYKLSNEPNPTMETLMDAWRPLKKGLLKWQETIKKPLLFTEVGWCSQEGTSIEPWNYYYKQQSTPGGLEEQRRCYRAFIDTWKDTPQLGGVIWWEWSNTPGGPDDYSYIPKGKPAEKELRDWFQSLRRQRTTAGKTAAKP